MFVEWLTKGDLKKFVNSIKIDPFLLPLYIEKETVDSILAMHPEFKSTDVIRELNDSFPNLATQINKMYYVKNTENPDDPYIAIEVEKQNSNGEKLITFQIEVHDFYVGGAEFQFNGLMALYRESLQNRSNPDKPTYEDWCKGLANSSHFDDVYDETCVPIKTRDNTIHYLSRDEFLERFSVQRG